MQVIRSNPRKPFEGNPKRGEQIEIPPISHSPVHVTYGPLDYLFNSWPQRRR